MWTRVRDAGTLARIPLRKAYLRWVMTYLVTLIGAGGAPSAPGIPTSVSGFPGGGHRALHDLQSGTVVVSAGRVERESGSASRA